MRVAFFVEVDGPDGAAIGVGFDAMHVRVGANLAGAGALRHADRRNQRTGFRTHLAAVAESIATLNAGASAWARLRANRPGRGEGVLTELASGTFKVYSA